MIIYIIQNKINNKCYVGLTVTTLKNRKRSHISSLNKNKHGNKYLQRSWNKYGKECFKFKLLERRI